PLARVVFALPSFWMLKEWLSGLGELAMPWGLLGYAQAPCGPLTGLLPLCGVLGVSGCMLALAGLVAIAIQRNAPGGRRPVALAAVALATMPPLLASIEWTTPTSPLTVALVQSGMPSREKSNPANIGRILDFYRSAFSAADSQLIVTPQLAIPKIPQALPPGYLSTLHHLLQQHGADALLGIHVESADGRGLYNGVLGVGASGLQQYLKRQLFPFGEFLPVSGRPRSWLNARMPIPMQDTLRPSSDGGAVWAAGRRVALAVCFEAAFGNVWRQRAPLADVLVNVSSDSGIDSRQIARQFLRVAQTRALELQKPLVRTSDMRGTFALDAHGRELAALPEGPPAMSNVAVIGRSGLTPYARWGDALPLGLALLLLALALTRARGGLMRRPASGRHWRGKPVPRGQALPAAIGLLLIACAFFYLMVNSGQAVTEKIRVTNAADAAAYSAAIVEARALNYDAYLNRAMVAGEISIAQMLSFASWVTYFANASDNFHTSIEDINFFLQPDARVLYLDGIFGSVDFASRYLGTTARDYSDHFVQDIGGVITITDGAIREMSRAQTAVHLELAQGYRQQQVADQVVKAIDPSLSAEVLAASHTFAGFTKTYAKDGDNGDERGRFADVTTRSRDPFTRERNWTIDSNDILLLRKDGALKKRGGTELIGYDEWRAVDTLELHGQRFGCGRFGLDWCDDVRTPIGWGAMEVDAGGGDAARGYHGNAYGDNPTTAQKAEEGMNNVDRPTPLAYRFSGIPDIRELADLGVTEKTPKPSTSITILVTKSQSDTLTSGNAANARAGGRLSVFGDRPAGGIITALSRAEVFFDRIAARSDGRDEIGSLYNPYWRVRLIAPTEGDKADIAPKQNNLMLP
ncbi:MAG TPA: apolipoprotein N-acyltransferase, partial [Burkholderiaceae bacterium]|nr:apolipoprotein N-acyltransferase [Burkholderiaceae bacterium]